MGAEKLQAELEGMQQEAEGVADAYIALQQETLRMQHEADGAATSARLREGAGGAKAKLQARLAAKRAKQRAHG